MKKKSNRRHFLRDLSLGSIGVGIMPATVFVLENENEKIADTHSDEKHIYNSSYTGEYLNRIAFPIGGLGAGMFCLEGSGSISHMSIRNKPETIFQN